MKLQLIPALMSVWRSCKMTHISLGNSVAGERHLGFSSWYRGPLCLLWLRARIIWVQNLSVWRISAQKPSKPAVFSLFVLFLLVLFHLNSFFWGRRTYLTYGIGYHFEILSSQVDDTKKELISCPGSNYVSIILHWLMLNATSSKPIHLNVSLLYLALL